MEVKTAYGYRCLAVALGLLVGLVSVGAALAESTSGTREVSLTVGTAPLRLVPGTFSAPPVPYSASGDWFGIILQNDGSIFDDPSGTGAGWHATLRFSDFAVAGRPYARIAAANAIIIVHGTVEHVAGQGIDPAGGPLAVEASVGLPLDTDRVLVNAQAGFGDGVYRLSNFEIQLGGPAFTRPGTYVAFATFMLTSGPFTR